MTSQHPTPPLRSKLYSPLSSSSSLSPLAGGDDGDGKDDDKKDQHTYPKQGDAGNGDEEDEEEEVVYPWFNLYEFFDDYAEDDENTIISAQFDYVTGPDKKPQTSLKLSGTFFHLWVQNESHPPSSIVLILLASIGGAILVLVLALAVHKFELIQRCAEHCSKGKTPKKSVKLLTEDDIDEKYMVEYPIGYSCERMP
jgi:hypothetical protein